jgi:nitronate monooxygenase
MGTGFLRAPEAGIHPAWAAALAGAAPEDTVVSRVFSGRAGRSLATDYVRAATAEDAPPPAPYPVQRGLTAPMRAAALKSGSLSGLQAWAGQSARLARAEPASRIVQRVWDEAVEILRYP